MGIRGVGEQGENPIAFLVGGGLLSLFYLFKQGTILDNSNLFRVVDRYLLQYFHRVDPSARV